MERRYGYAIVGNPGPGLLLVQHHEYGEQLWALCKMRTHKADKCAICGLPVGDEAYRPVGNSGNRMRRICTRTNFHAPLDAQRAHDGAATKEA